MFRLAGVQNADAPSVFVCQNALRNIFHVGLIAWKSLVDDVVVPTKRLVPHLDNNKHKSKKCTNNAIAFYESWVKPRVSATPLAS